MASASVSNVTGLINKSTTFDGSDSTADILTWSWTALPSGTSLANSPIGLPDSGASSTKDISMSDNEGLYHFDGNAGDYSGNGRHGFASNATQTTGKVGSGCYSFDESTANNVVYLPGAGFDFVSADAFSISVWVKPNSSQPDANAIIFSNSNLSSTGYAMFQNGGANSNAYSFIVGTGSGLSGTGVNFSLTADTWSHVCLTRSANGAATKIYVNGVVVTNASWLTTIAASGLFLTAGNFVSPNAALSFNGELDEMCIWSRELASHEVIAVYRRGSGDFAGFGESFSFTSTVTGIHTVQLTALDSGTASTASANGVISDLSLTKQGDNYQVLDSLYQGNKFR